MVTQTMMFTKKPKIVPIKKFKSLKTLKFTIGSSTSNSHTMKKSIQHREKKLNQQIQVQSNQPYCCPLSNTTCIENNHKTKKVNPKKSTVSFLCCFAVSFTVNGTTIKEKIPIGVCRSVLCLLWLRYASAVSKWS